MLWSCDRATVGVNVRLGLVDEEDRAGVGRMVDAGECSRAHRQRSAASESSALKVWTVFAR